MAKRIHNPPHSGDVLQDTVLAEGRGEMGTDPINAKRRRNRFGRRSTDGLMPPWLLR